MNTSCKNGFLFGLLCPGLWGKKEATMYSYNGVVAQALPETPEGYEGVRVVIHSKITLGESTAVYYCKSAAVETSVLSLVGPAAKYSLLGDGTWGSYGTTESGFVFDTDGSSSLFVDVLSIWTDTDIYYADGSLYVAASDPVPVYE